MDKFNDKVIVIATANDFMKIEKAVRSRFQLLDFGLITADDFLSRARSRF
jgi:AAA+ superfamily predicted ATPase